MTSRQKKIGDSTAVSSSSPKKLSQETPTIPLNHTFGFSQAGRITYNTESTKAAHNIHLRMLNTSWATLKSKLTALDLQKLSTAADSLALIRQHAPAKNMAFQKLILANARIIVADPTHAEVPTYLSELASQGASYANCLDEIFAVMQTLPDCTFKYPLEQSDCPWLSLLQQPALWDCADQQQTLPSTRAAARENDFSNLSTDHYHQVHNLDIEESSESEDDNSSESEWNETPDNTTSLFDMPHLTLSEQHMRVFRYHRKFSNSYATFPTIVSQSKQLIKFGNHFPLFFNISNHNTGNNVSIKLSKDNPFPKGKPTDIIRWSSTTFAIADGLNADPTILYQQLLQRLPNHLLVEVNSLIRPLDQFQDGYLVLDGLVLHTLLANSNTDLESLLSGSISSTDPFIFSSSFYGKVQSYVTKAKLYYEEKCLGLAATIRLTIQQLPPDIREQFEISTSITLVNLPTGSAQLLKLWSKICQWAKEIDSQFAIHRIMAESRSQRHRRNLENDNTTFNPATTSSYGSSNPKSAVDSHPRFSKENPPSDLTKSYYCSGCDNKHPWNQHTRTFKPQAPRAAQSVPPSNPVPKKSGEA